MARAIPLTRLFLACARLRPDARPLVVALLVVALPVVALPAGLLDVALPDGMCRGHASRAGAKMLRSLPLLLRKQERRSRSQVEGRDTPAPATPSRSLALNGERPGPAFAGERRQFTDERHQARGEVAISTHALWRLRLVERLPRWLLYAVALAGLLASARFAIAPPRPAERVVKPAAPADLPAQSFASLFARAYLTWEADDLEARQQALAPFTGSALDPEAGMQPPSQGSEHVLWEQLVQQRQLAPRERMYTIAVDTDAQGLVYLTVPVARQRGGALALAGYPALVGAPESTEASGAGWGGAEVEDRSLSIVIQRALRNYLAPAPADLAADLAPRANVSTPHLGLSLESIQGLTWAAGGRSVVAIVTASSRDGARWTLAYEVEVVRISHRWEVAAIQTDPAE